MSVPDFGKGKSSTGWWTRTTSARWNNSFRWLSWKIEPLDLILVEEPVSLRPATMHDYEAWYDLRTSSRSHLTKWEPDWREEEATKAAFMRRLRADQAQIRAQRRLPFLIFRQSDDCMVGGISLSDIRLGNRKSGVLGYWIGAPFVRTGMAQAAITAVNRYGFESLGLNRIEAACQPGNIASRNLLIKMGFQQEGLARDYLKINGKWRDHEIWAKIRSTSGEHE